MLIEDILRRAAERWPNKVALLRRSFQMKFGELEGLTNALAADLASAGVLGGHVGILTGNRIEYVVAYFGAAKSRNVIVPFAPSRHPEKLWREAEYCDVGYILATPELAREKCLADRYVPILQFGTNSSFGGLILFQTMHCDRRLRASHPDTSILLSTSGTVSAPRRVMLSHTNVVENMLSFVDFARLEATDRALITLPLTASGTNTTELLAYLHCGITAILYSYETFSLWNFCKQVKEDSVTVANVTPFILKLLAQHSPATGHMLDGMRKFFCASAPLGAHTALELSAAFSQVQFCYGYGLTEAGPRCTMLASNLFSEKAGSSGKALCKVHVRVEQDSSLGGHHAFGEIVIEGPNVMQGYYKLPAETSSVLRDGSLYTGDLGHLDSDGFLYVDGRRKNVILSRGVTICPEEVEEVILEHPGIADAVVTGTPDDLEFQRIVAIAVLREGWQLSETDLLSFLAARLEPVRCPKKVEFVPALSRNELHKLVHSRSGSQLDA